MHATLATHWARLIEMLYAAERTLELATDPEITSKEVRTIPTETPTEGIGIVEAPRGTLTHHYITDERGLLQKVKPGLWNYQQLCCYGYVHQKRSSGTGAAGVPVGDAVMNKIEMAFRAYDPCLGCATHAAPGDTPLIVRVFDHNREQVQEIRRD